MKAKRILSYILIFALCLSLFASLAGCGDQKKQTDEPGKPSTEPGKTEVSDNEFVYVPEYVKVEGELSSSFDNMVFSGDRFLASMYGKIGERELEEGEVLEWEGQNWIWGQQLYWLSMDGKLEEISGYTPLDYLVEIPREGDGASEAPEAPEPEEGGDAPAPTAAPVVATKMIAAGYDEKDNGGAYMQRMLLSPAGDIITVEQVYRNWYDGPDDDVEMYSEDWWAGNYNQYMHNEQRTVVRMLNADGTEKSRFDLDALKEGMEEDMDFYINSILADGAGRFYCTQETTIHILSPEGKPIGKIEGDQWYDQLIALGDGSVAAVFWGEDGQCMAVVDPDKLTLGEPVNVPNNMWNMAQNFAGDYDFCYTDGSNFMGYSLAAGKSEKILNWINSDVDNANANNTFVLPDGRIMTVEYEWNKDYTQADIRLVFLKKVPASSVPQKTKLIFATQSLNYQARSAIIEFNRKSDEYRIELHDYSEYNTEDDYSAGLTKLTTEIMAGNMPDILDLTGIPVQKLASRGLLADLYPMLDSDAELSRDAIFPSVLKALEQDGHLYRTAAGFQIISVVGAKSVVGEHPGWTLAQFKQALARMPEGCTPFNVWVTRDVILNQMLQMAMGELVDWDTGKCYFDSPVFRDILEFAAQFPEEYEWDEDHVWTEDDEEPNRIATGKQMLMQVYLDDINTIQMYNAMFGGEATFVGYPVSEGVGNALRPSEGGYAISAKCAHPEAAWQFVRKSFTKDYQTQYGWGFPSNRAAFDERLKEAMTPEYQKDEKGNYILDENGEKIEISRGGWGWGSLTVDFYALTQAEADQILELIDTTVRVQDESSDELMQIITQDTAPYFAGQKSLDDVVRQLQSKMNIYINEQR